MRRRVSSKDGMFRTGDTGTVGFRIDLRGNEAVDYKNNMREQPSYFFARVGKLKQRAAYLASVAIGLLQSIQSTGSQTFTS